jgi:ABC-2 type transport system ATP-binding protein
VRSLQELGKTILLTTHYLDEAQALCDRVAIVKEGRILAEGPPGELGAASTRYRVAWRDEAGEAHAREVEDPTALLHQLTSAALARGEALQDLSVTRPSLEDVYLELTAEESEEARHG